MLTRLDDYPIHQTPEPLAHGAGASLNQYDRYFFNGYNHDGSLYFGCALGLYPNRRVMDAAFAVLRDGEVVSVIASTAGPARPDRDTGRSDQGRDRGADAALPDHGRAERRGGRGRRGLHVANGRHRGAALHAALRPGHDVRLHAPDAVGGVVGERLGRRRGASDRPVGARRVPRPLLGCAPGRPAAAGWRDGTAVLLAVGATVVRRLLRPLRRERVRRRTALALRRERTSPSSTPPTRPCREPTRRSSGPRPSSTR